MQGLVPIILFIGAVVGIFNSRFGFGIMAVGFGIPLLLG